MDLALARTQFGIEHSHTPVAELFAADVSIEAVREALCGDPARAEELEQLTLIQMRYEEYLARRALDELFANGEGWVLGD